MILPSCAFCGGRLLTQYDGNSGRYRYLHDGHGEEPHYSFCKGAGPVRMADPEWKQERIV